MLRVPLDPDTLEIYTTPFWPAVQYRKTLSNSDLNHGADIWSDFNQTLRVVEKFVNFNCDSAWYQEGVGSNAQLEKYLRCLPVHTPGVWESDLTDLWKYSIISNNYYQFWNKMRNEKQLKNLPYFNKSTLEEMLEKKEESLNYWIKKLLAQEELVR